VPMVRARHDVAHSDLDRRTIKCWTTDRQVAQRSASPRTCSRDFDA
jgi:hypothetical protein